MRDEIQEKTVILPPFRHFIMSIGEIPTSYLESMTYYEMLVWFTNYLGKTVIPAINENGEAVTELQNLFVQLQNYVNNYFDNLDVQDEINNKLDEMAQSGELNELIKKLDYFIVDNTYTQEDIQKLMNLENAKIIEFKDGTYNFDNTFILNKDTTLLLNNANLVFSVTHGFFNFKPTDEYTEYNGNGNIKIIGGTINAGISFIHGKDLVFKNINFYHVLNDHMFEICALKNVYIENCVFDGLAVQPDDRGYVECIQIDDCTRENFPWLTENNPTYDETPNYNINIEKCIFKKTNIITYTIYTAIGSHTHIDNKIHKYITIKNNEFYDTWASTIRLANAENVIIDNNLFEQTDYKTIIAIELIWFIKDVIISNNNNNHYRFLNNNTRSINVKVENNYIHDIPNTENEFNIIDSQPSTNFIISDNLFENIYSRIIDNRERPDILDNEIIIFKNNIIRSEENTSINMYMLAIYGSKHLYVINNIIDINPTNNVYFVRLNPIISSVHYANNRYIKLASNIDLNGYINSLSNVYEALFVVNTWDEASLVNYEIQDYNIFDFNRVGITCGTGGNTQNFVFKPFYHQDRLSARTYKVNGVNNEGATCIVTFTINEDGTISYSASTGTLKIRQMILYNE